MNWRNNVQEKAEAIFYYTLLYNKENCDTFIMKYKELAFIQLYNTQVGELLCNKQMLESRNKSEDRGKAVNNRCVLAIIKRCGEKTLPIKHLFTLCNIAHVQQKEGTKKNVARN